MGIYLIWISPSGAARPAGKPRLEFRNPRLLPFRCNGWITRCGRSGGWAATRSSGGGPISAASRCYRFPSRFCFRTWISPGAYSPATGKWVCRPFTRQKKALDIEPAYVETDIDISDFSLSSPEKQAFQITSLQFALNTANQCLADAGYKIELARSNTGDGFYVWNQ